MPIISIIEQPSANDLKAAYRPVVFKVRASRTDSNARPPVVYCDIYVNGVYYKSNEKTQYTTLNFTNSDWQFDIKDAVQEILKTFLPANGGSATVEALLVMSLVYCKFRSSGYDTDGFITAEGTAPVQGTGTNPPVSGTGTQSNSFFVANSTLQHDQNQNLATHLNYYKSGTWASNVFPLSHRPNGYKICNGDSDFFPIVNLSDKDLKCLVIHFKLKGDSGYSTQTYCPGAPCVPVAVPAFSFGHATKDIAYTKTITVTGTAPFIFSNVISPSWMVVNVSGASITFHGTPTDSDVGDDQPISFEVANDCGSVPVSKTIDVAETTCIPVAIVGTPSLPSGLVGQPYSYSFNVSGDADFAFGAITVPTWMAYSINQTTKTITLSGTPTAALADEPVSVEITNCGASNSVTFEGTLTVETPTVEIGGSVSISGPRSVIVNLDTFVPCDILFPILVMYDDGGTPTEAYAPVTVESGYTEGQAFNVVPSPITCIETNGPSYTFLLTTSCGGTTYNFTLTVNDPC